MYVNPVDISKIPLKEFLELCKQYAKEQEEHDEDIQEEISDRPQDELYGSARIVIHFENRAEWQKYRRYILKTDWDFDGSTGPRTAYLDRTFRCAEDLEKIAKEIANLMQIGFDVYSCHWTLDRWNEQKVSYVQDGEMKDETIKL